MLCSLALVCILPHLEVHVSLIAEPLNLSFRVFTVKLVVSKNIGNLRVRTKKVWICAKVHSDDQINTFIVCCTESF